MKLVKFTIILLSLFSCTLLLAQEATKSFNLNTSLNSDREESQELDKKIKELERKMKVLEEKKAELVDGSLSDKVKIFAEDFIQPIMRGEAYDISIGEVEVLSEYQKNNSIKCGFDIEETFSRSGCHDRNSYYQWFDEDIFDQEPGEIVYPFTVGYTSASRSLIVPIKIELKKDFQKNLINFLEAETSGMDYYSYKNLPLLHTAEAFRNEYIQCMKQYTQRCSKSLGRYGGVLPNYGRGDSWVINFINREQKEVTFYNLKNYKEELIRTRKHRFLTDLCSVMGQTYLNDRFDASYRNQEHVQFNDIAVTFNDADNNQIYKLIINAQEKTDRHYGKTVNGIAHRRTNRNFTFTYDYGSNALIGADSDHLGYISMIGHLITDTRRDFNRSCMNAQTVGNWADYPAFSLVSNYEYNLIVQLDNNQIQKVSSIDIKYVKGSTSTDEAYVSR
tara:strand:+ start:98 stop:1438 length:1341 start_codon:yes stop_codon:yes gene_type:complete